MMTFFLDIVVWTDVHGGICCSNPFIYYPLYLLHACKKAHQHQIAKVVSRIYTSPSAGHNDFLENCIPLLYDLNRGLRGLVEWCVTDEFMDPCSVTIPNGCNVDCCDCMAFIWWDINTTRWHMKEKGHLLFLKISNIFRFSALLYLWLPTAVPPQDRL